MPSDRSLRMASVLQAARICGVSSAPYSQRQVLERTKTTQNSTNATPPMELSTAVELLVFHGGSLGGEAVELLQALVKGQDYANVRKMQTLLQETTLKAYNTDHFAQRMLAQLVDC